MPFTPFHMGLAMLVKAAIPQKFSLMVFGWTQIVMDLQPLVAMVRHSGHVHGFSHTYLGSILVGGLAAVTGKYVCPVALQLMSGEKERLTWKMALLSAAIGSLSHVALDSIMHSDVQPFAPFSESNFLLGVLSTLTLHQFCLASGAIGAAGCFLSLVLAHRRSKRKVLGAARAQKTRNKLQKPR